MNLAFLAGGRRRNLTRRKPNGPFHVRFENDGIPHLRSLGTTNVSLAKLKGKELIESVINGDQETSRKLKQRSDYSTLQEIADIYIAKFGTDARRKRTARGNVGCLEKIVRMAAGADLEARSTVLTGKIIRDFEAKEELRIARDRNANMIQASENSIRESICSVVRQARSIFKRSHMSWFESLALPNLESFRDQGVTAPDRARPRPLDEGVIEQINANAPTLAKEKPSVYIAHLLFKFLGMRNVEQKAARRAWLRRTPDLLSKGIAAQLGVIYRPEEGFKPKKKTERWIPMGPGVLAEIERYWTPSPDGDFLVPAVHKTDREDVIDDQHCAWAGQWIKDRAKVSYELRRHAGAMIYKKTGKIEHVQQFLGHADIKTTMDWYWYLLEETPALDMADFAPPPNFSVVA